MAAQLDNPRQKSWLIASSAMAGLVVLVVGGISASSSIGLFSLGIDQKLEQKCHRAIKKRVPLGHDEIKTTHYDVKDERNATAKGSMMAKYNGTDWARITWICELDPATRRVLNSEVTTPNAGRRALFGRS